NAVFLAPVPVTADKLNLVIDAGWIEKDKVCNGAAASVAACQ
ncbi:MAG: D-xylose transport system substrate-binding protein, partial [Granulosicoccus sp.]